MVIADLRPEKGDSDGNASLPDTEDGSFIPRPIVAVVEMNSSLSVTEIVIEKSVDEQKAGEVQNDVMDGK